MIVILLRFVKLSMDDTVLADLDDDSSEGTCSFSDDDCCSPLSPLFGMGFPELLVGDDPNGFGVVSSFDGDGD